MIQSSTSRPFPVSLPPIVGLLNYPNGHSAFSQVTGASSSKKRKKVSFEEPQYPSKKRDNTSVTKEKNIYIKAIEAKDKEIEALEKKNEELSENTHKLYCQFGSLRMLINNDVKNYISTFQQTQVAPIVQKHPTNLASLIDHINDIFHIIVNESIEKIKINNMIQTALIECWKTIETNILQYKRTISDSSVQCFSSADYGLLMRIVEVTKIIETVVAESISRNTSFVEERSKKEKIINELKLEKQTIAEESSHKDSIISELKAQIKQIEEEKNHRSSQLNSVVPHSISSRRKMVRP